MSMSEVLGGTLVADNSSASCFAVMGKPSLSMTRWVTTSLFSSGMYVRMRRIATSSFWYAAAVVDPSIDTINRADETYVTGSIIIAAAPTMRTNPATSRYVDQNRCAAATKDFRFNPSPPKVRFPFPRRGAVPTEPPRWWQLLPGL